MGAICGKSESKPKADKGQAGDKPVKSKYQMKLGLVGTSSCGKTTVAKQMRILHGGGFTDQEKATFKTVLVSNILVTFKELIRFAQKMKIELEVENEDTAQSLTGLDHFNTVLTPELVNQIQALWKDKAIQEVYGHRNEFYIPPNTEYCLSRLESLLDPNAEPTTEDILRARLRSAGVTDNVFQIGKFTWTLVDPGGQRSERRKWPQFFGGVVGMIYVAGLDEWDCLLVDEPDKTRLQESLDVWDSMVNDPVFQPVPWILFLNKKDLFAEKIKEVDLSKTFPEYKGGDNYDKGIEFMKQLYLSKVKGRPTEDVFTHITCALDTEQIKVVFQSVTDFVFKQSAKQAGVF